MANDVNRLFLNQVIPMGAALADLERQVQAIRERLLALERLMAETDFEEQIAALTTRVATVEEYITLWHSYGGDIKPSAV